MNTIKIPNHIAIIMDGNRRWAREKKLPTLKGHNAGGEAMKAIITHAGKIGINYLTVYAFSSENWDRPLAEVKGLLAFFQASLKKEVPELHAQNVRLKFVGDKSRFSKSLQKTMADAEILTAANTGLTLCPAMNYGSWEEITLACRAMGKAVQEGTLNPAKIDTNVVESYLHTAGIPAPDLLIRPGGEHRLSNFLLLQCAYAELIFDDTLWPNYSAAHLDEAIAEFQRRSRRYGR